MRKLLCDLLVGAGWLAALYIAFSLYTFSPDDLQFGDTDSGEGAPVVNAGGRLGAWLASLLWKTLGGASYLLAALCALVATVAAHNLENSRPLPPEKIAATFCGCALFLAGGAALIALARPPAEGFNAAGALLAGGLGNVVGAAAAAALFFAMWMMGATLAGEWSWLSFFEKLGAAAERAAARLWHAARAAREERLGAAAARERDAEVEGTRRVFAERRARIQKTAAAPAPAPARQQKPLPLPPPTGSATLPPPLTLLSPPPPKVDGGQSPKTLEYTARSLEKNLADFGIEARVENIMPGPVITRYDILPATGVKGAQIVNLMKDLARALSVASIRVLENIPGSSCMGLEVPNARRETVHLSELLSAKEYADIKTAAPIALGMDSAGRPVIADLCAMPHLLVAGATGAGKSVSLNSMILGMLFRSKPDDLRLIMIDPKMLELSVYRDIPHLLAPVVTDMEQAPRALAWCVEEMERRYRLMADAGVRGISAHNKRAARLRKESGARSKPRNWGFVDGGAKNESAAPNEEDGEQDPTLEHLPHIVVIIDELADLMMITGKKVEQTICRLTQKARAAGIHLILATQRPSVDVITGLVKANVPSRVAFQVTSRVDSRTILDVGGAESLLGRGDMLYQSASAPAPIRAHGALVGDDEVHRVADYLRQSAERPEQVSFTKPAAGSEAEDGGGGGGEDDELYDQAVAAVVDAGRVSVSLVQRKLRIGYNRAARLVEEMERAGLVSPMNSMGVRTFIAPKNK